jgi:hypothetical protein
MYITTEGYLKRLEDQTEKKLTLSRMLEEKFKGQENTQTVEKFSQIMMDHYLERVREIYI